MKITPPLCLALLFVTLFCSKFSISMSILLKLLVLGMFFGNLPLAICCLGLSLCVGVLRDKFSRFLGGFTVNLGFGMTYHAKLIGVMNVIECAHEKCWCNLWVKIDSKLVILMYNSYFLVPLMLRNMWTNCLVHSRGMNFTISNSFKKDNIVLDKLANLGFSSINFNWDSLAS